MIGSIILLIVLIFLNAIFASAEIAVISMNDAKLKKLTEEGNKKAIKLTKLTEQPARFLATIQVVITLAGFLNSAFAADYFADPLVDLFVSLGVPIPRSVLSSVSVIIITVILSYFNLVFGELVPKRIAMTYCHEKDRIPFPGTGWSFIHDFQDLHSPGISSYSIYQRCAETSWN